MDLRSMLNPVSDAAAAAALKTPQRTVSLAQPFAHSPPLYTPLPRTTSLPAQSLQYRESSASVSPKTMPPPAPVGFHTPSPVLSRKRSLSSSDHQLTPQPALKRRRYPSPPPWARRERDSRPMPAPRAQPSAPPPPPKPMPKPALKPESILPLEPSIDNHEPYNDLNRKVGDWLWEYVIAAPDYGPGTKIEVEAKIGTLLEQADQHMRLSIPVWSEAVLVSSTGRQKPKFESLMSMPQHRRLNEYLNRAVRLSKEEGRCPVDYQHVRETDAFYDLPPAIFATIHPAVREAHESSTSRGPRVRVTTDNKSKQIKATIVKTRIADLEIFCPNDDFDYRISVSLETAFPHPVDGLPEHMERGVPQTRVKDRLSYRHQGFQVDLTQVTLLSNPQSKAHELEIEIDTDQLIAEGRKVQEGRPNEYEKLVAVFLNNVKVINRAAKAQAAGGPM